MCIIKRCCYNYTAHHKQVYQESKLWWCEHVTNLHWFYKTVEVCDTRRIHAKNHIPTYRVSRMRCKIKHTVMFTQRRVLASKNLPMLHLIFGCIWLYVILLDFVHLLMKLSLASVPVGSLYMMAKKLMTRPYRWNFMVKIGLLNQYSFHQETFCQLHMLHLLLQFITIMQDFWQLLNRLMVSADY